MKSMSITTKNNEHYFVVIIMIDILSFIRIPKQVSVSNSLFLQRIKYLLVVNLYKDCFMF